MHIVDIIWLPHIVDKLAWKHSIEPEEINQVLFSDPFYRKVQNGHTRGEHVYSAFGRTDAGRYLVVFFIYKLTREALILSTRKMTKRERQLYERS